MRKVKFIFDLEEDLKEKLKSNADEFGVHQCEIIRQMVRDFDKKSDKQKAKVIERAKVADYLTGVK